MPMNILMLSHSDSGGGAAIAARRLQQGLRALGEDVRMLVRRRTDPNETVAGPSRRTSRLVDAVRFRLDKIPLLAYSRRDGTPFSPQWLPDRLLSRIQRFRPDIVNVHWIGHGFVHPATLARIKLPIVWTLHDVWPFTGGCHVNLGCTRFQSNCGACPRLGSNRERDLSRTVWRRKRRSWSRLDVTLVAPSTWMADAASRSTLFRDRRIEVIANGLDTNRFRPGDRRQSRARFNLPQDKMLILLAAAAGRRVPHKGYDLLEASLRRLETIRGLRGRIELVLAGRSVNAGSIHTGLRVSALGALGDEDSMAALYAAIDVTVVPSRQESLGMVAVESLACGTPVVAFDTAGVHDVVDHQQNGFLADPFSAEGLASGVQWVLEDADRYRRLCHAGRAKALRTFDLEHQVARYRTIFRELLADKHRTSV